MKAWIFRRYGGPEVLEWAELPDPVPGKGEMVVRVVAAALNPLDWKLREGHFRWMTTGRLPPAGARSARHSPKVEVPDVSKTTSKRSSSAFQFSRSRSMPRSGARVVRNA